MGLLKPRKGQRFRLSAARPHARQINQRLTGASDRSIP